MNRNGVCVLVVTALTGLACGGAPVARTTWPSPLHEAFPDDWSVPDGGVAPETFLSAMDGDETTRWSSGHTLRWFPVGQMVGLAAKTDATGPVRYRSVPYGKGAPGEWRAAAAEVAGAWTVYGIVAGKGTVELDLPGDVSELRELDRGEPSTGDRDDPQPLMLGGEDHVGYLTSPCMITLLLGDQWVRMGEDDASTSCPLVEGWTYHGPASLCPAATPDCPEPKVVDDYSWTMHIDHVGPCFLKLDGNLFRSGDPRDCERALDPDLVLGAQ